MRLITNIKDLDKIENEWNGFIRENSENPIFLCDLVKEFMNLKISEGQHPLILVFLEKNKITGLIPLAVNNRLNLASIKFLFALHYSPDIIAKKEMESQIAEKLVIFWFKTLGCKFADLVFPSESSSLPLLKAVCGTRRIPLHTYVTSEYGHRVLPVKVSWDKFEKLKGGNFKRRFRKIERKMKQYGDYEVNYIHGDIDEASKNIFYIEKNSWKETWRKRKGQKVDPELIRILNGIRKLDNKVPDFKWALHLLKINNEPAAYVLIYRLKKTAYISKTSYNQKFKRFYPGVYVINSAIRTMFEEKKVEKIDFQTNLPVMKIWTPIVYPRVRVMMGKASLFSLFALLSTNKGVFRAREKIVNPILDKLPATL